MKQIIITVLTQALATCRAQGQLPAEATTEINVDRTRDSKHGDFASNIALVLAKPAKLNPRVLAEKIIAAIPATPTIAKVEIAGPGFINFFLQQDSIFAVVNTVLSQRERFGRSTIGAGQRIQVEFVSANPTGPLHVGHGRGAAYGSALASVLTAAGYNVDREYYVNDAGRQMDILAASVWLRYLELCGEAVVFPTNAYKGDYVWDIAATLHRDNAERYRTAWADVTGDLPADEPQGGDKEDYIDAIIARMKTLLSADDYRKVFDLGLHVILDDIRDDLQRFSVNYDQWYSERSLADSGAVQRALDKLQQNNHTYHHDGALWFRSTAFGDEKDRVLVRDNGQTTYFASDVAYHLDKFERGFDKVVNIWGADHHGYVPRVKGALQAMGIDPNRLTVLLVQFAILYQGGHKVQMSTRSGEFITLRELRKQVGSDATRFFYVMRKSEQHLDFDMDLAKSQSSDNPMYYIQYAHARVNSVLRKAEEKGWGFDQASGLAHLNLLTESHEQALLTALARYPEVIESAAKYYEPHQVTEYLRELAQHFHTYNNAHKFLVDDAALRNARLALILAVKHVVYNGLTILGVSAPESM
ncbi:MAG: arginine--tRNA ligase [Gammaproteobacteria bacterium]|nr:arginine--tRNA ligase [Gammaproteobacteria bacterium]